MIKKTITIRFTVLQESTGLEFALYKEFIKRKSNLNDKEIKPIQKKQSTVHQQ